MPYINPRDAYDVTGRGIGGLNQIGQQSNMFAQLLMDPNSSYYTNLLKLLNKSPGISRDAFLSPLLSKGGNYQAAQVQAGMQRKQYRRDRADVFGKYMTEARQQGVGLATNLMGLSNQAYGNIANIGVGLRNSDVNFAAAEAQQGGIFDALGPIGGILASAALAPMTGGTSLLAGAAAGVGAASGGGISTGSYFGNNNMFQGLMPMY